MHIAYKMYPVYLFCILRQQTSFSRPAATKPSSCSKYLKYVKFFFGFTVEKGRFDIE